MPKAIKDSRRGDSQDGNKHDAVEQAGTNNGPLLQVLEGEELHRREPALPGGKSHEAEDSNDNHDNHAGALPTLSGVGRETEGQEEQRPPGGDEDNAEDLRVQI